MQQTFIMIKPDGVARGLIGEIIHRIERRNLKIIALKMLTADRELAMCHYTVHQGQDFFEPLVNFITSGPVVAMVVEGDQSIAIMRKMMGAFSEPLDADTGTIRGDFTVSKQQNIIHGSDSPNRQLMK